MMTVALMASAQLRAQAGSAGVDRDGELIVYRVGGHGCPSSVWMSAHSHFPASAFMSQHCFQSAVRAKIEPIAQSCAYISGDRPVWAMNLKVRVVSHGPSLAAQAQSGAR
jgi:hypothetical protein